MKTKKNTHMLKHTTLEILYHPQPWYNYSCRESPILNRVSDVIHRTNKTVTLARRSDQVKASKLFSSRRSLRLAPTKKRWAWWTSRLTSPRAWPSPAATRLAVRCQPCNNKHNATGSGSISQSLGRRGGGRGGIVQLLRYVHGLQQERSDI